MEGQMLNLAPGQIPQGVSVGFRELNLLAAMPFSGK
jgi:hypothetical protein